VSPRGLAIFAILAAFLAITLFSGQRVASAWYWNGDGGLTNCLLIWDGYGPSGPSWHHVCRHAHQNGPFQA
jgi:hypothetical protein